MIPLLLTAQITVYLLGPDLLSRFILGFVCPQKVIVQSKSEEFTRAIAWAILPLLVAVVWAMYFGPLRTLADWGDWRVVISGLYSSASFEKMSEGEFADAANALISWNLCILWRLYLLVSLFWVTVDVLIVKFGRIRKRRKTHLFNRLLTFLLELFVIPRVSDWHLYLSTMLTEHKDTQVFADILTSRNIIYKGRVVSKELAADGKLASVTLGDPSRFRREQYLKAKETDANADKDAFWAPIQGNTFLILGSEISTINLRHWSVTAVKEDQKVIGRLRELAAAQKVLMDQQEQILSGLRSPKA